MKNKKLKNLEEALQKRLHIISFFDKYGVKATRDAFGVSRATVYLCKKRLKEER